MMAAVGNGIAPLSCGRIPRLPTLIPLPPAKRPTLAIQRRFPTRSSKRAAWPVRCSPRPDQSSEVNADESPGTSFLAPEELSYLWKLAAGSVGSASVIKYGSILYPEITRPNIVQALLMISVPVLVAVLILVRESSTKREK